MPWITLPHQLNNRKFNKAVVFVHGLDGSAASWKGGPDKFVDLLSRERPVYNHIALYVFQYDPKIFSLNPIWKLIARIPGCADLAQKATFNAAVKKTSAELKAGLIELFSGYKTIVFVGHGLGSPIIKRATAQMSEPPTCHFFDIDDPDDHAAFQKLSALLHQLLELGQQSTPHSDG